MRRGLVAVGLSLFILSGAGAVGVGASAQTPSPQRIEQKQEQLQRPVAKKQWRRNKRNLRHLHRKMKRAFKRAQHGQAPGRQRPTAAR